MKIISEEAAFMCPFCSQRCVYGMTDSDSEADKFFIGNRSPVCKKFQDAEPLEYLLACRHEMRTRKRPASGSTKHLN